jgi:hypothetical protein
VGFSGYCTMEIGFNMRNVEPDAMHAAHSPTSKTSNGNKCEALPSRP